jgi:tripartite-type tricarboxylate transporter receptor subunit TctC
MKLKKVIAVGLSMALLAGSAGAQSYPSKPIHIVVGYPAGGSTDDIARLIGQKMSASLDQPVIVENKPGAAGQIGSAAVAKAQPDGYTILFTNMGPNAIAPSLNKG